MDSLVAQTKVTAKVCHHFSPQSAILAKSIAAAARRPRARPAPPLAVATARPSASSTCTAAPVPPTGWARRRPPRVVQWLLREPYYRSSR
jgi:hypothetical protein